MNLNLPHPWNDRYRKARTALLVAYLATAGYFAFVLLFPAQDFHFDFHNPLASKNTILRPRTGDGTPVANGRVPAETPLVFDTALQGSYSHATLTFDMEKDAAPLERAQVSVRKSYRAFLYPKGLPAMFPTGTLLRNHDVYFIVDETGSRIRLASLEGVRALGYDPQAFLEVSDQELSLNPEAVFPTDQNRVRPTYENGTLFRINETYYQLLEGRLHPFVSENAYLTRYARGQAVPQNPDLLQQYPVSEEWLGFKSGSLLAFADGVFIVDGREVSPIGSATIFEAFGFSWNDVIPASEEEMGIYERGKIFLTGNAHPDGTVFVDTDTGKHFLIQDGQRREITGEKLLAVLLGSRRPVPASEKALDVQASCSLAKVLLFKAYACDVPLAAFESLPGNTFEFRSGFTPETDIRTAQVVFETAVDRRNLYYSLSQIKQRILLHYGYGQ
jgi:hypothetical protein